MALNNSTQTASSVSGSKHASDSLGFFDMIQIRAEDILELSLVYRNHPVPFSEAERGLMIEKLQNAVQVSVEDDRTYYPSEYQIAFHSSSGEVIKLQFYWFSGIEGDPTQMTFVEGLGMVPRMKAADNRFDVVIGDAIVHFRFTGDDRQTEFGIRDLYDTFAKHNQLPLRETIDGSDRPYNLYASSFDGLLRTYYKHLSYQEILDSSDIVAVAVYDGPLVDLLNGSVRREFFYVEQLLKGDAGAHIDIQAYFAGGLLEGERLLTLHPVESPSFVPGQQYLLCLRKSGEELIPTEQLYNSFMDIEYGKCYPRYNSEHHPFRGLSIDEIQAYLRTADSRDGE